MLRKKEIEINGVKYQLQALPFKSYLELSDRHTNKHGVLMKTPFMEDLLEHCVISPKVKLNDFSDDYQSGMELVTEIESFLQSKPEPKSSKDKGEK